MKITRKIWWAIFSFLLVFSFLSSLMLVSTVTAADSPYGMNTDLFWMDKTRFPDDKWQMAVEKLARSGAKYNRTTIRWAGIQRENNPDSASWNWQRHDQFIQLLNDYQITPLAYFFFTPTWAKKDPGCTSRWEDLVCAPNPEAWKYFIRKTVERYGCQPGGRCQIKYWELWNEQDLNRPEDHYFIGTVDDYFEMLYRGYQAIKETDPQAIVLLGGISQLGLDTGGFLDQLLAKNFAGKPCRDFFDIMSFHYYYGPDRPEDVLNFGLAKINWLRGKYNLQDKPLWVTELNRGLGECGPSLTAVAQDQKKAFDILLTNGVKKVFWFDLASSSETYCWYPSILNKDTFQELQPLYQAYQEMTGNLPTATSTPIPAPAPKEIISSYGGFSSNTDQNHDQVINGVDFAQILL